MVSLKPITPHPVVLLDTVRDHLGVVHSLAATGHYQLTTVGFTAADALRFSRMCRHEVRTDWRWDRAGDQLDALCAPSGGAVLLPVSLRAVQWVIENRRHLADRWRLVPLPSGEDFQRANDKAELARLAERIGLRVPCWVELDRQSPARPDEVPLPALVKPRRGFGGSGIVRVENHAELQAILAGISLPNNYLLQSIAPGRDVSCGVFCRDGKVVTSVAYRPLARQGQFGRFTSIESIEDGEVVETVSRLMRALSWNGIANVDLVRAHDGVYVLEVNPRCWGNMAAAQALGVNFADMLCRAALGHQVAPQHCRGGRFFSTLDSLALLRDALVHRGVRRRLGWRRLAAGETSLRYVIHDPLPYMATVVGSGAVRGVLGLLREVWTRRAPTLRGR